ncbi:MAG: hypothetical protein R3C39_15615 [Dehalococcoidia bacterium]
MQGRHRVVLVLVAMLAAGLAPPNIEAQTPLEPAPMVIEFRSPEPGVVDLAHDFGGRFTAYADGVECAVVMLAPNGGALAIGLAGQATACSRVGAAIALIDGRGFPLANRYFLHPGEQIEVTEYLVYPPHGGPMVLRLVASDTAAFEAARGRTISVFVGGAFVGTLCSTVVLEAPVVLLLVGLPDQPEACEVQGEFVTFADEFGRPYFEPTRNVQATVGLTYRAADALAPAPTPQPTDDPAPVPPAAGAGPASRAERSTAGLRPALAAVSVLFVLLVAAGRHRNTAAR